MHLKEALNYAYEQLAPYSDRHRWEFYNNLNNIKFFIKYVPKGSRVLDVGAGMGIFALTIAKLGYRVEGLDKYIFSSNTPISLSFSALEKIETIWHNNNIKILNKDIFDYESSDYYDCVMNVAVIEHQKDPKRFLEACISNLKNGGYFYCVTPNMVDLLNRFRVLAGRSAFRNIKPFYDTGEKFVGHWREYTLSELEQMCKWASLQVIEAKNYRTSPYFNKTNTLKRGLFLSIFRCLANFIPGGKDTNSIIAQKI
jgi:2-polyprenyl-3-methyl-5-hydroxy-6-metoxy-1,4-benzoquinol methylase